MDNPTRPVPAQVEPYVVGRYYHVPAIRIVCGDYFGHIGWHGYTGWLPVMGPEHEDAELINFPYYHYHIDWRFAPKRLFDYYKEEDWFGGFAHPLQMREDFPGSAAKDPRDLQTIIATPRPIIVRLKCKRDWPIYPAKAKWLPKMQALYAGQGAESVCPHRGIPASCYIREEGGLRCPGHGLLISAETGKVADA